jgi:hypothetical protein
MSYRVKRHNSRGAGSYWLMVIFRACICKCLWSPEIDSEESTPSDFVVRARIFNRLWSPGIDSASLCGSEGRYEKWGCRTGPPGWESIPGLLKWSTNMGSGGPVWQIGLQYRPARLGSIPGLHKRFTNTVLEPEFVKLLRSPGIDSQPGGSWAGILKSLWGLA